MPEGMGFPQNTEMWAVFIPTEAQERRNWRGLNVFGRVRGGVDKAGALTDLNTIANRIKTEYPKDYEELGGTTSGAPSMYEMGGRQYLLVTAAAAGGGGRGRGTGPALTGPTGIVAYALPK